ncbi:MAG: YfhO family protein [Myxococcales bacterium]|nr:YfhO family protein [Myxococcales bacterium]
MHSPRKRWRAAEPLLVAFLLAAALLVFCRALLTDDPLLLGRRDVYRYFVPAYYYGDRALQQGDLPEWNPLLLGGLPHAANVQTAQLYPPNLVRGLLNRHPTPDSTEQSGWWLNGLHVVWVALGVYVLGRRRGLLSVASFAGALTVLGSAAILRRFVEWHFLFTLAWLPWIWLSLELALRPGAVRRRLRWTAALAGTTGLALLGGFAQLFPYVVATTLVYVLAHECCERPLTHADWPPRARLARLALPAVAALPILFLAAPQLLPTWEFIQYNSRATGTGVVAQGWGDELPLRFHLASVLLYGGPGFAPEAVRGAGLCAAALALLGLIAGGLRRTLPPALVLLSCVDLAVGPPAPLSSLIEAAAPFQMVSRTRVFDLGVVSYGMLASLGVQALYDCRSPRRRAFLLAVCWLAICGGALAIDGTLTDQYYLGKDLSKVLLPCLLLVPATVMLLWPTVRGAASWLVPLCLFAELALWSNAYFPFLARLPDKDRGVLAWIGQNGNEPFWPDNHRGRSYHGNENLNAMRSVVTGYDPMFPSHSVQAIAGPKRAKEYHRELGGPEAFQRNPRGHNLFKRQLWLVDHVVEGRLPRRRRLFPPTRFAYVVDAAPLPSAIRIGARRVPTSPLADASPGRDLPFTCEEPAALQGGRQYVVRCEAEPVQRRAVHSALRLGLSSRGAPAHIDTWILDPLSNRHQAGLRIRPRRRGKQEAWVPMPDHEHLNVRFALVAERRRKLPKLQTVHYHEDRADLDERIRILKRTPDSLQVQVDNRGHRTRYLVVLDADYPGWQASIDGQPTRLHRTNDGFKGLVVPAGDHQIVLSFRSTYLRGALWLAGVTLLALVALLGWTRRTA